MYFINETTMAQISDKETDVGVQTSMSLSLLAAMVSEL